MMKVLMRIVLRYRSVTDKLFLLLFRRQRQGEIHKAGNVLEFRAVVKMAENSTVLVVAMLFCSLEHSVVLSVFPM